MTKITLNGTVHEIDMPQDRVTAFEKKQMSEDNTIIIKMKPNWAHPFRLEYDGKYITLWGGDKNYIQFKFLPEQEDSYEEMVLVPCVIEKRRIRPAIISTENNEITINLNPYDKTKD